MKSHMKLIMAAFTAVLVMGMAVGSASANRLSVSNRNIRIVWESLILSTPLATVRCPVTIEGSFHYWTMAKTERALIGHISRASVGSNCTGGHATVLPGTLPWHITYDGFRGVLPRITAIFLLLIGAGFLVEVGAGTSCLYLTSAEHPAIGTANREGGGGITSVGASGIIPLHEGTFGCPNEGEFGGEGRVTLLGNTSRITVTLI